LKNHWHLNRADCKKLLYQLIVWVYYGGEFFDEKTNRQPRLNTMTQQLPLVISRPNEDPALLRRRFNDDGYLYFKRAVSRQRCDHLMHQMLQCLAPHIAFDHEKKLPQLIGKPFFETDAIWDEVYPKIQSLPYFHDFFHQDDVQQLMQLLVGEKVFVYPMKLGRVACPKKLGYETPAHQDARSHQAGPTMAGMWVALHDTKQGMGRLQILPASHKDGVRPVTQADGVGGVQCEILDHETIWHVSDVEQGDVIIFHSCCVHRAEPNTTDNTVRLSIDTRFCDYGAPVFVSNLDPHHGWRIDSLNWDSIYQDWPDTRLQYYWRDYPEVFSDFRY